MIVFSWVLIFIFVFQILTSMFNFCSSKLIHHELHEHDEPESQLCSSSALMWLRASWRVNQWDSWGTAYCCPHICCFGIRPFTQHSYSRQTVATRRFHATLKKIKWATLWWASHPHCRWDSTGSAVVQLQLKSSKFTLIFYLLPCPCEEEAIWVLYVDFSH